MSVWAGAVAAAAAVTAVREMGFYPLDHSVSRSLQSALTEGVYVIGTQQ